MTSLTVFAKCCHHYQRMNVKLIKKEIAIVAAHHETSKLEHIHTHTHMNR